MTKSEFLSILSIQSDRLKAEHEKPGWNIWALLGALSSVCWIILELYSKDKLEFHNSILMLIMVLILDPLISFIQAQFQPGNTRVKDLYINLKVQLKASLPTFWFKLLVYSFILYCSNLLFELTYFEKAVLNIYAIAVIIVYVFLIILSRFDLHVKVPTLSKALIKWFVGLFLFLFLGLCTYILISKVESFNVMIAKSAMLFTALYLLAKKTIEYSERNPLLDSLDELIDEVTFDEISIEEAEQQLYMIVNGIEFSQLMSPFINEYQQADKKYHELLKVTNKSAEDLKKSLSQTRGEAEELVDDLTKKMKILNDQMELIHTLKSKIDLKIGIYSSFEKESEEYNTVKGRFDSLDEKRAEEVNKLYKMIESIRKKGGGSDPEVN